VKGGNAQRFISTHDLCIGLIIEVLVGCNCALAGLTNFSILFSSRLWAFGARLQLCLHFDEIIGEMESPRACAILVASRSGFAPRLGGYFRVYTR
jgi:hypothetical protein